MLYSRLCSSVDMLTYICFEDESFRVRGYLDIVAPGLYELESHHVRPYDGKAWDPVRRALVEAVEELAGRAQQLALRLRSLRPSNRARATAGALKLVEMLRSARASQCRVKAGGSIRAPGGSVRSLEVSLRAILSVR
jgi:hypothetical protein